MLLHATSLKIWLTIQALEAHFGCNSSRYSSQKSPFQIPTSRSSQITFPFYSRCHHCFKIWFFLPAETQTRFDMMEIISKKFRSKYHPTRRSFAPRDSTCSPRRFPTTVVVRPEEQGASRGGYARVTSLKIRAAGRFQFRGNPVGEYNNSKVPSCIYARAPGYGYVFCVLTNAPCSKVSPVFQRWIRISIKYDRMSHIADTSEICLV